MDIEEQVLLNELNKIRNKNFHEKRTTTEDKRSDAQIQGNAIDEADAAIENTKQFVDSGSTEFQEKDIIRLLINYSNQDLSFYNEETKETELKKLIDVVIVELEKLSLSFTNQLYKSIYNEFVEHHQQGTILEYNHFVNHTEPTISGLTIDLISSPYTLSNWAQHNIEINTEADNLKKSVLHSINALHSRIVELEIIAIQHKLKESTSDDEAFDLMVKQHELIQTKKQLNQQLGRIVLK
jgi:hypothetical protein